MVSMIVNEIRLDDMTIKLIMTKGFSNQQAQLIQEKNIAAASKKRNQTAFQGSIKNENVFTKASSIHADVDEATSASSSVNDSISNSSSLDQYNLSEQDIPNISTKLKSDFNLHIDTSLPVEITRVISTPRSDTNILQQYPEGYNASSVELLLSLQIAKYGLSMHDIITPARGAEMKTLMQLGNSYDEAALILFQEYVSSLLSLNPEDSRERTLTADSLQAVSGSSGGLPASFSPLRPGPVARATSDDGLSPTMKEKKKVSPVGRSGLLRPQSMHSMSLTGTMQPINIGSAEEGRSRPLSKRNPFAQPNSSGGSRPGSANNSRTTAAAARVNMNM
jgi:hypothetical protein